MEQLAEAILDDDFKQGFHIAHTIKSSSGQLGAVAMQNEAMYLEEACKAEDRASARGHLRKIQKIFLKTLTVFKKNDHSLQSA